MTICKHSMLNNRTKGPGLQNAGSLFTMFVFVFVFVFVCVCVCVNHLGSLLRHEC